MKQPQRGNTLPEVLIGLLVLIPVAVVVVGMFPYAHTIDARAWALSTAQSLAESELETQRSVSFNAVNNTSYHHLDRGMDFLVNVSVTPVDAQLWSVTSNVTWQFQRQNSFHLTTYIAKTAPP
jgi:type II secretory pathway pseudopilin PulG